MTLTESVAPPRTRAQTSRDAALRRLTRVNHSLAVAAVVGVGVLTDVVAHTASGHTVTSARTTGTAATGRVELLTGARVVSHPRRGARLLRRGAVAQHPSTATTTGASSSGSDDQGTQSGSSQSLQSASAPSTVTPSSPGSGPSSSVASSSVASSSVASAAGSVQPAVVAVSGGS